MAESAEQARTWLRIYLGYAPGVGKTYAMLNEGRRRRERGTDVVVGLVETYQRPMTMAAIGDLEVIPRKKIEYRGVTVEEMDVDAILARKPQVVLIDELAHSNVPGSKHEKRYQDVLEVRDAGINVVSTVNVQHIESLHDTVERITGITVRETVPDWVVDQADELEMIDQSPEALQKRMLHGNIYPQTRVDDALQNFFRKGNLAALRELTLRRMAEHTDDKLQQYMQSKGIEGWHCKETVLVCVPPTEQASQLVRRGVHLAERLQARLVALYVGQPGKGLNHDRSRGYQEAQKALRLAGELGAEVVTRPASKVADALVDYASEINATQIVMGESTRSWLRELIEGSVIREVLRRAQDVDVHIVQRTDHQ
jgi:two-component system sensor histidine kinase KdpD